MFKPVIAAVVLAVATAAGAGAATLWHTDGSPASLAVHDAPAIVFWEDRASHTWNQPLKDALWARGRALGLTDRVRVLAVANVAALNFFPARQIATRYIRALEARVGVPILLDLDGVLAAPPWNLPATGAAVVVLDGNGRRVFERRGRLSSVDVEETLAVLQRLIAEGS